MRGGLRDQALLELGLARAQQRELAPLGQEVRQRIHHQVDALLVGEACHHAHQRPGPGAQAQLAPEGLAAGALPSGASAE